MKLTGLKITGLFICTTLLIGSGCENKKEILEREKIIAGKTKHDAFVSDLNEPDSATLYSLEPSRIENHYNFRGYQILGQLKLNPEEIKAATLEFKVAIDSFKEGMPVGACFNPRVGLRITKAGKNSDFVLCYECRQMEGYDASNNKYHFNIYGSPDKLNAVLTAARIPVSSPSKPNQKR